MLLENGNRVFAVEPNRRTCGRPASNCWLRSQIHEHCRIGGGDNLPDASVDFVSAAQAGHWFDRASRDRSSFAYSQANGWLGASVERARDRLDAFSGDYEQLLLRYGTDYADVRHERTTDSVNEFFDPLRIKSAPLPCARISTMPDWKAGCCLRRMLRGRDIRSMSRCFVNCVRYSRSMRLVVRWLFHYKTRVYFGHLTGA